MPMGQLKTFAMALRYGRDMKNLELLWQNFLTFVVHTMDDSPSGGFVRATIVYLTAISDQFTQKLQEMGTGKTATEGEKKAKTLFDRLMEEREAKGMQQGMQQGIEKLIQTYMKKSPHMSDQNISDLFEVSIDLVKRIREKI